MNAWIMSIVGVICLGILLEIVLPEGKTTKYIRGAFSLMVIFVIVAPLPSLLKKDWNFELGDNYFSIDQSYVDSIQMSYSARLQDEISKYLLSNGYNAEVVVEMKEGESRIEKLKVCARSNPDISNEAQIISLKTLLNERFHIDADSIEVYLRE